VVRCKDTTGFIANRIGCFAMQQVMWLTLEEGLGFDEVDAITARPSPAQERDLPAVRPRRRGPDGAGRKNFAGELAHDEQAAIFKLPGFIEEMVKRGGGATRKARFLQEIKSDKGTEFLTLDPNTFEYRPRREAPFASLAAAARLADPADRCRLTLRRQRQAGAFCLEAPQRSHLLRGQPRPELRTTS